MRELLSLGALYPSDFLRPEEQPRTQPVELKLVMEDNGFVHLEKMAPKDAMWGDRYWYKSGVNSTMKNELKSIVESVGPLMPWDENDIWLDIACNDGTLLGYVPEWFIRIGCDPSAFPEANDNADVIIKDYFSFEAFKNCKFGSQKAKIITSIAMFYDLEEPDKFIQDVYKVLDDSGLWVMQLSYTPLMIEQLAFDNICHEHYAYYTLTTMMQLLGKHGFVITDCQLNDTNGGSFRLYIVKSGAVSKYGSAPHRDVCNARRDSVIAYEQIMRYNTIVLWEWFAEKIEALRKETRAFIIQQKKEGRSVWAYGASTKGNTLLQYFGLDNTLIDGIADRNPDKWGLRTIGTDIPIYPEDKMREVQPDYLLILPWHFVQEFKDREQEYLKKGGKFIIPCPQFEIYGNS